MADNPAGSVLSKAVQIAAILGLFTGGLGGSLLTWWLGHPGPTILAYSISSTTIGADPSIKALIPNLTIRIWTDEIPVLHTHSIELTATHSFSNQATIATVFPLPTRFFGTAYTPPSPLHSMSCSESFHGFKCILAPLDPRFGRFTLTMVTDSALPPVVMTTDPNIELATWDSLAARRNDNFVFAIFLLLIVFCVIMFLASLNILRLR